MSYLVDREIKKLKSDIQSSQIAIDADKEIFAAQLLGGLGEDMRKELRNPTKPKISTSLKVRLSRWLTKLIERWNNLEIKRS
jgi:hypothetical protein